MYVCMYVVLFFPFCCCGYPLVGLAISWCRFSLSLSFSILSFILHLGKENFSSIYFPLILLSPSSSQYYYYFFFLYICFISFLFFICSGGNVVRATLRRGMIEMIFVTFLHTPCFISIHFVAKPLPPPPLPEKFVFFFFLNNKTKHKQPHTHSHTHSYTHSHTKTIMIIPGLTLLSSSQLS